MTLIDEWQSYCQGNLSVDKSHFEFMLVENTDDVSVDRICSPLPGGNLIAEHIKQLLKDATPNGFGQYYGRSIDPINKLHLVESFITASRSLKDFLEKINSDEMISDEAIDNVVFIENIDTVRIEYRSTIVDYDEDCRILYFDRLRALGDFMPALLDAIYNLTTSYNVCYFILAHLIDTTVRYDIFYDIWLLGVEFEYTDIKSFLSDSQ